MPVVDRRTLLRTFGGTMLLGPFAGFAARQASASHTGSTTDLPSWPPEAGPGMGPVADRRDGKVRLWLPEGFQYRSFHDNEYGATLDDGSPLPVRHDGMAAFQGDGDTVVLVRNHEVPRAATPFGDVSKAYDTSAGGGTTTVRVTRFGEVLSTTASLNGTMSNCSGGQMPWGSWISCEETVNGPDVGPDWTGEPNTGLRQRHGFIFEVPVAGESNREPITSAGRFCHESVAFDPSTGYLYLTEDMFDFPSGFYRYQPPDHPAKVGMLRDGGRLQMLAVRGRSNAHLEAHQSPGATYHVTWVDIDDPNPSFPYTPTNLDAATYVSRQGRQRGAALFSRLEGSTYHGGIIYFTSTQGGGPAETEPGPHHETGYGNGFGQVWAYDPRSYRLKLVYQSPGKNLLDFPDNVTTSRSGTLILSEDHDGGNYLRALTQQGKLFSVALNRTVGRDGSDRSGDEFAGSTFSPDGHTLFVNLQGEAAMTVAIWGDWHRIGV